MFPEYLEYSVVYMELINVVHIQESWGGPLIQQNSAVDLQGKKSSLRKCLGLGKCYSNMLFIFTNTISFLHSRREKREREQEEKKIFVLSWLVSSVGNCKGKRIPFPSSVQQYGGKLGMRIISVLLLLK